MNTGNYLCRALTLLAGLFWLALSTVLPAEGELYILYKDIHAAPILNRIESADLLYETGSGRADITNSITISDTDSKNLRSATIRITEGYHANEDILNFKNQNGIIGFWNKNTGILTLAGSASLSNYRSALRSIQYENTNAVNPSNDRRKVTFTVNDGLTSSNTVYRYITIYIPNDAPVLGNIETSQIVYCVNSGEIPVTSSISVSDGNNQNLSSAKIQITSNYTRNEDFLRFTNRNGITASWDASDGILTLTGIASKADYQQALRSIRYENTNSENPETGVHTVSFVVNDGTVYGNSVSRGIYVNGPVSAVLNGNATLCGDESASIPLEVKFQGTPPWKFTITRNNGNERNYDRISENPYSFNVNQQGTYRIKSISDANCTGDTTGSGSVKITFNTPPTAVLSGGDTICQGGTAELSVLLTGKAPWNLTYNRNGSNPTVINNINTPNYKLRITSSGIYTLSAVTDALCTNGKISGSASVIQLPAATALLSGDVSICENASAALSVSLTGTAPWRFSYKKDNGTPVIVQDVNASPKTVAVNQAGYYTLFEVYDKNCKGTVSGSARIQIQPAPDVTLSGLASAYNKDSSELVPLFGSPAGGIFSGPGVIPYNNEWYFLTSLPPAGTHHIVYAYRQSPTSCFGYDTVVVRILEASAVIDFPQNRTNICRNEEPFTIRAVNLNNSIGNFTIAGGIGLINNGDNTATIDPRGLGAGNYTITYTYTDVTTFSVKRTFEIGNAPVADFKWESECFEPGQSISFRNTSATTFGSLEEFVWTVSAEGRIDTFTTENIEFAFADEGRYVINLTVNTTNGCTGEVSKTLGLSLPIELAGRYFHEDFEDSTLTWHSNTLHSNTVNSWTLSGISKGFTHTEEGRLFWHTYIPSQIGPVEESWVTSPCFDFSGTDKPMVILDIWQRFNNLRNGAALQATSDSGKTWTNIGLLDDGINWFNSYEIRGNLGNQHVGWAGFQENEWMESRHDLDMLKGKKRVQFRMIYGSDGTALNSDGIAFDNFIITERNRNVLLEHFTNSSDSASRIANGFINTMVGADSTNLVDLQYHTSFPGHDPFNAQDPYVSNSRLLYYGLVDVPYTILNGGTEISNRIDYRERKLTGKPLRYESLEDTKFKVQVYSKLENNNALYINTWVTAMDDMPSGEYTVHVGVIERKITEETGTNGETVFENVVKTFLPDPAGTTLYRSWNTNDMDTVDNYWYPQNVYNLNELKVFAFIQDESTNEVYQVALNNIDLITGIRNSYSSDNTLFTYPNPASDKVFVKLDKPVNGFVRLDFYNNLGALVKCVEVPGTSDEKEISTSQFPDGMYIIRAVSGTSLLGVQKLNISH